MGLRRRNQSVPKLSLLFVCLLGACGSAQVAQTQSETVGSSNATLKLKLELVQQSARLEEIVEDCLERAEGSDAAERLINLAKNVWVQLVDLNGDGKPEMLVSFTAACAAGAHSTPLFVYGQTPRGDYVLLIQDIGQDIVAQKSKTNGWRDIAVISHNSAVSHTIEVYKYVRGRYRAVKCYDEEVLGNGRYKYQKVGCPDE